MKSILRVANWVVLTPVALATCAVQGLAVLGAFAFFHSVFIMPSDQDCAMLPTEVGPCTAWDRALMFSPALWPMLFLAFIAALAIPIGLRLLGNSHHRASTASVPLEGR